jgi:hypothetical protein
MRRALAAIAVLLLLAPQASAQVGPAARTLPTPGEIAAQASFDTSALLAAYMAQLAVAGNPPTQADIDEATRQYFTNGAAVTSVPSSGPGAEYFRNGAVVTSIPSSGPGAAYFHNGAEVMAYYREPPPSQAPEPPRSAVPTWVASEANEEEAGAPEQPPVAAPARAAAPPAPATEVRTAASAPAGPTCSPLEIEAAMAIARQFAAAAAVPSPAGSCPPTTVRPPAPEPIATAPASEAGPACPAAPSPGSRVVVALGGVLLGGFAVALWAQRRRLGNLP